MDGKISMVYPEYKNARSQDLEPIYHDAGQVLFLSYCFLCGEPDFWGENTARLVLSELEVQDLDTQTDWALARDEV